MHSQQKGIPQSLPFSSPTQQNQPRMAQNLPNQYTNSLSSLNRQLSALQLSTSAPIFKPIASQKIPGILHHQQLSSPTSINNQLGQPQSFPNQHPNQHYQKAYYPNFNAISHSQPKFFPNSGPSPPQNFDRAMIGMGNSQYNLMNQHSMQTQQVDYHKFQQQHSQPFPQQHIQQQPPRVSTQFLPNYNQSGQQYYNHHMPGTNGYLQQHATSFYPQQQQASMLQNNQQPQVGFSAGSDQRNYQSIAAYENNQVGNRQPNMITIYHHYPQQIGGGVGGVGEMYQGFDMKHNNNNNNACSNNQSASNKVYYQQQCNNFGTQQPENEYQKRTHTSTNFIDLIHALPHLVNVNQRKEFVKPSINSRFFVIKSFNEQNVHKSIKYNVWASTKQGHQKLNSAFVSAQEKDGDVYLFFSVNGNQQFMGVARMISPVDFTHNFNLWTQKKKFEGFFNLQWIYIKDIANKYFRKILIASNQNKPVTNSRDCQQVPYSQGSHMLKTYHNFNPQTSLLDDYDFYQKRQQDQEMRKQRNLMKKNKQRKQSGVLTPPLQATNQGEKFTQSPHRLNPEMKIFTRNPNHPSYQNQKEKNQDSKNQNSGQVLRKGIISSQQQQQQQYYSTKQQYPLSEQDQKEEQQPFNRICLSSNNINTNNLSNNNNNQYYKNSPPDEGSSSYNSSILGGLKHYNIYNCSSQGRSLSPLGVFNVDAQNELVRAVRKNFTSGQNTDDCCSLKAQELEIDDEDDDEDGYKNENENKQEGGIDNQGIKISGQQSANFNFPQQTQSQQFQKDGQQNSIICRKSNFIQK